MINVTKTYLPNIDKYKKYVDKIFNTGWVTNNGHLVHELEKRLKKYLGVENLVLVTNGTLALQLAYKLLKLKGEVITTPFSFVATTSSLVWEGLKPNFIDIDYKTLNIDYRKIERKITKNTCCILPVHVFGNGCNVEEIYNIANEYNLKIIYDAAHAFGIKYKKKSVLKYGDISILSFHATKVFHTIEGGALIINDDKLYENAKKIMNFGISAPGKIESLGINAKMNEFQAAMGLCVLDEINDIFEGREKVYRYYIDNLSQIKDIKFQLHNENCTLNYGYFPIIFKSEKILLKVKYKLEEYGIFSRRYFYPSLETLSYLDVEQNCPISNDISKRILCIPLYNNLEKKNQDIIIQTIKGNI